jgi:hypothetical protein
MKQKRKARQQGNVVHTDAFLFPLSPAVLRAIPGWENYIYLMPSGHEGPGHGQSPSAHGALEQQTERADDDNPHAMNSSSVSTFGKEAFE